MESKEVDKSVFGGTSIDYDCFLEIRKRLGEGKTLLELGSGRTTAELCKFYKVYSVEHNEKWCGLSESTYIHAPLTEYEGLEYKWYNVDVLKKELPKEYDLILVDGCKAGKKRPTARHGFYHFLHLFNIKKDTVIIFDDVHRKADFRHMQLVAMKLGRVAHVFDCGRKNFGVI